MSKSRGRRNSETTITDFTPTVHQDEFLRGDKRYFAFVSGVGAGKTYAGIIRTFLNMERWNPGEMGAIVAPTRQMVVNVIIPEMRDLGLLDKWEYNSSHSDEPGIHSPNGSRALILSADNEKTIERLRGLNLSWGWIDERTAVPSRAKEILSQRLRTGNYRNLFETTTPKGKDDTYNFYVRDVDAAETTLSGATVYETGNRLAIVGVPTSANPHTPQDYKEAMESDMPDQIRAQEIHGQFVEIGAGVYQKDMFNFISPTDISDDWTLQYLMSVDPANDPDSMNAKDDDNDYWAVTLAAYHSFKNQLYALDNVRQRGMTLKEGVAWVSQVANGVPSPKVYVEGNQSQKWLQQELKDKGLNAVVMHSNRDKEERLIEMTIPIENGAVKFVNRDIDKALGYDPRWENLIGEALAFPEGSHDDCLDSVWQLVDNVSLGGSYNIMGANPHSDDDE